MRKNIRNPFAIRTSEKIDTEHFFLKLFSHFALENLAEQARKGDLWDQLYFIRSSPGGGKTSLLRIFQPTALSAIWKGQSIYKDLFNLLKGMDVISEEDIKVIGVVLPIRDYDSIEDIPIESFRRLRIFYAMLNARLTISLLKALLDFKGLPFPDGLSAVQYNYSDVDNYFKGIDTPCSGIELYNWAVSLETQIAQAMDSFNPEDILGKEGHGEPFCFSCLQPSYFKVNEQVLSTRFLFMIDDVHSLSSDQRKNLKQYLLTRRITQSVWLSERLSALDPVENLGSQEDRDYSIINIERYWSNNPKGFRRLLSNIAENRANLSSDGIEGFENFLQDQDQYLELTTPESIYLSELEILAKLVNHYPKYASWVNYAYQLNGSYYSKALVCRQINVLVNRDLSKKQLSLDFESSLTEIDRKLANATDIKGACALFIARQYNLPHYSGFENLVSLSNQNIQQFLGYSSSVFEHILSQRLTNLTDTDLKAPYQEKILKQTAANQWKELPRLVNRRVITFLQEFARYAERETYRASAPYTPGVTGFAVSPSKKLSLFDDESNWLRDPVYKQLVITLSDCVAYNLLLPSELGQGKKGDRHTVYYLNRWLCLYFSLPFGYGGWRHKAPNELIKWIK